MNMKKKLFLFALVFVFTASLFKLDAFAYTSTYYNNQIIKVALTSMKASTLTVTLDGDYTLNGELQKTGTSYSFKNVNSKILFNEAEYDLITLIPANGDAFIKLQAGSTIRNYRGNMTLKVDGSSILAINTLNIEDYTKGVIGYEMSESYPLQALKVQAVASRSFGMYKIGRNGANYDVVDTETSQVYRGFNKTWVKVEQAVDETKGEFLSYKGSVVEALFSATHGGYSEASENVWSYPYPYFISQKDEYDDYNKYANVKSYDWTRTLTAQNITDRLNSGLTEKVNKFVRIKLDTISTYVSGRISKLEIVYTDGAGKEQIKTLTKDSARTYFNFPSAMYTVSYDEAASSYIFKGHGAGHGIGMSQIGAKNRALANQKYEDILTFYFPSTSILNGVASIKSLALNQDNIFTGEQIDLQAQAQGGSGQGYLYKYVLEKDGQVVEVKDFADQATYAFTPDKVGNYTITVLFKDSLSKLEYDQKKVVSFKATGLGDVNLDGTVDIFDLVSISKNFEKTKSASTDWNIKQDLVKDEVINILDIAKAAQSYNIKY
jgi:stage II sporulation protein D